MFDNPQLSKDEINELLRKVGVLTYGIIDILKCEISPEVRYQCVELLDNIGFFKDVYCGDYLREQWSKNV